MDKTQKVLKKYKMSWIDETGTFHSLGEGETKDLRNTLFNEVCKSVFLYPNIFKAKHDKIMDNIKQGQHKGREHWYAELGNQVISIVGIN